MNAVVIRVLFRQLQIRKSTLLDVNRTSHEGLFSPRYFTSTTRKDVRTIDMSEKQLAAVKIDRDRLWRDLHATCEWGQGERWGE